MSASTSHLPANILSQADYDAGIAKGLRMAADIISGVVGETAAPAPACHLTCEQGFEIVRREIELIRFRVTCSGL
jgi:hypothetical protein